jgi:hypothetical protein
MANLAVGLSGVGHRAPVVERRLSSVLAPDAEYPIYGTRSRAIGGALPDCRRIDARFERPSTGAPVRKSSFPRRLSIGAWGLFRR